MILVETAGNGNNEQGIQSEANRADTVITRIFLIACGTT